MGCLVALAGSLLGPIIHSMLGQLQMASQVFALIDDPT